MIDASTILLGCLDSARKAEVAAIPDLADLLASHLDVAAREWPTITLDHVAYLRHLADKLAVRSTEPADHVIRSMPSGDLWLACACTNGNPAAIAAFHDAIFPTLRPALTRLALAPSTIDEAEQRVLIMILVGDPDRPAIAAYSGRGRLKSWVRSIAVRTARRLAGITGVADGDDELDRITASVHDPELALLRERYHDQVRSALAGALGDLSDRKRTVLRQYYIDGLTIDRLAALYKVDRATTARWVIAARSAVLESTRERLRQALGASTEEVESILRLVQSGLEVSLRLLGST